MVAHHRLSRRYVLTMTAAIGGLGVSGGIARGQTTPRIEKLAPELDKIISTSDPVQYLADGFGGPLGPAEGPVWWKEGRYLLFSDIHNNRRMKYEPRAGVTVFFEPTNRANGLTRDLQGRLMAIFYFPYPHPRGMMSVGALNEYRCGGVSRLAAALQR